MNEDLSYKVMKAVYYLLEGVPLKDFLSDSETEEALCMLADILCIAGIPHYKEEDDEC